ncbi:MAG: FKBP-type peptidyl-prolyl cis-trans isomerase SlyD [Planctomycetota bacterium]
MNITQNALVTIAYKITDSEGVIFEQGQAGDAENGPIDYIHGNGELPEGLESALEGKTVGAVVTAELTPESGFGDHDPELIIPVPREEISMEDSDDLKKGDILPVEIADEEGNVSGEVDMRVIEVRPDTVFLDGNHPLAGQNVTFDVEVLTVREATEEELEGLECETECDDPTHDH